MARKPLQPDCAERRGSMQRCVDSRMACRFPCSSCLTHKRGVFSLGSVGLALHTPEWQGGKLIRTAVVVPLFTLHSISGMFQRSRSITPPNLGMPVICVVLFFRGVIKTIVTYVQHTSRFVGLHVGESVLDLSVVYSIRERLILLRITLYRQRAERRS